MSWLKTAASAYSNVQVDPEWPKYDVVESNQFYEKRSYRPFTSIAYTFTAKSGDEPVMSNLWKLVKYTQGENIDGKTFKIYLPIMVKVRPSLTNENENCFTLMMVLDKEFSIDNPAPVSKIDGIFVIYHSERILYARRFGGFAKEADWKRESLQMVNACKGLNVDTSEVISATYDMPMKLFNRRNEVLVAEVKEETSKEIEAVVS